MGYRAVILGVIFYLVVQNFIKKEFDTVCHQIENKP